MFAAPIGMHAAATVGLLVSAAGFPLVAAPDLQSTIQTTVYLATIASPTDSYLPSASTAKKQPARSGRCAAGSAYVVLQ
jgi:hypothetical protein